MKKIVVCLLVAILIALIIVGYLHWMVYDFKYPSDLQVMKKYFDSINLGKYPDSFAWINALGRLDFINMFFMFAGILLAIVGLIGFGVFTEQAKIRAEDIARETSINTAADEATQYLQNNLQASINQFLITGEGIQILNNVMITILNSPDGAELLRRINDHMRVLGQEGPDFNVNQIIAGLDDHNEGNDA